MTLNHQMCKQSKGIGSVDITEKRGKTICGKLLQTDAIIQFPKTKMATKWKNEQRKDG